MDPNTTTFAMAALAAIGLAVILLFVLRDHRTLLPIAWFGTICFVPVWVGLNIATPDLFGTGTSLRTYIPPAVACAAAVLLTLTLLPSLKPIRWTGADLWMLAFFGACLLPALINASNKAIVFTTVTEWVLGFALGRMMPNKVAMSAIYRAAALAFGLAAVLGVIEFFTHWNPFVEIHRANGLFATWGGLQERGGIVRAEGAFGHSIAFGCSLGLAVPLLLATRLRERWKLVGLALIGGAALVTFSRLGMLTTGIAIVLSLLFLRGATSFSLRTVITLVTGALALVAAPFVTSVFTDAGQEAVGSSDYRRLLVNLLPEMSPLGISSSRFVSTSGTTYFGTFQSIDDAVILTGLRYGWIPMLIMIGLMASAVVALLRRRATPPLIALVALIPALTSVALRRGGAPPPLIALVALIPALTSVALITQFGILTWFLVGLAADQQSVRMAPAPDHAATPLTTPRVPVRRAVTV